MKNDLVAKLINDRLNPLQRLITVLIGAVLIHLSLGTYHTFGNMLPYMASYLRNNTDSSIDHESLIWIPTFQGCFPFAMIIGGLFELKLGTRFATMFGCSLMVSGVYLSYWSIKKSFIAFLATYGMMFGLGQGIAYVLTISAVINWAPEHVGIVSGIVTAGFAISSSIFAPIQTIFINPNNYKPTVHGYFMEKDLVDRVPSIFYVSAIIYAIMQLIGIIVICHPPDQEKQSNELREQISSIQNWPHSRLLTNGQQWFCSINDTAYSRLNFCSNRYDLNDDTPIEDKEIANLDDCQSKHSWSTKEMLCTSTFYWLFIAFFCCSFYGNMFYSLYKTFGETFIDDDMFMAFAFSVASILSAIARIAWGLFVDCANFQKSLSSATLMATFLLMTMPLTPFGGKWIYFIWMNLMFVCMAATHSLFISACVKCFGVGHKSTNYGFLVLSTTFSSIVLAFGCEHVLSLIGYSFSFTVTALFAFIAFLLAISVHHTSQGQVIS